MTELERVRDAGGAERWLSLASACVPADHPGLISGSLEEVLLQVSGDQRSLKYEHFLAVERGVDVAYGTARLTTRDNLLNATVSASVLPAQRRRGIGTMLAKEILAFVQSEGRTNAAWTVGSPIGEESPGCAFSRALGANSALSRLRRELDLTVVNDKELDALASNRIDRRSSDYRIVTWIDRAPDELVEGVAQLVGRMSTDAPSGDLSWEPEVWDAARWREKEDDAFRSGRRRLAAGAVDGSGHLVAFTDIGVYVRQPGVAEQWNTIVDPEHRGHRLGLATKVANLRNLRREVPLALRLETWNAIENSHMIEINELLGFQIVERVDEYQLTL
jgi:GNAT superfamily N-acetyltransferase/RimJ/RimL family protein N-acetyltransferase